MAESWVWRLLLAVLSVCSLVVTVTLLLTAREFRLMLRRVNALLPEATLAFQEAHRLLRRARRLLTSTTRATEHVEAVVHRACDAASEALTRLTAWTDGIQAVFTRHVGNGSGADPRPHQRSRK